MDIYGDDIDSILGPADDLNANIQEIPEYDDNNDENINGNQGDATDGATKVEPKRRTVRNPQLRLNVERLTGDRGIHKLEEFYTDIKFKGKGHEADDLDNVMKRMEHWAHRLYPKYNFKDFLATTERLGKKKPVQRHMSRYRTGMLDPIQRDIDEDDEADARVSDRDDGPEPIDEFDDLIGQQIEKYRTAPPRTPGHNNDSTFNTLKGGSVMGTPTFMGRAPVEASTPIYMDDIRPLDVTPVSSPAPSRPPLTSEMMARIAENRRIAQERLKARRAEAEAKAKAAAAAQQTNEDEFSVL